MQIPPVLMVLLVGLAPIAFFTSLIVVPGSVKWQPPLDWQTTFGTPSSANRATAMAVDKTGIYSVGYVGLYYGGLTPPSSSYAFLNKYDFSGHRIWSQPIGDPKSIQANSINIGPDGLYISGINWSNKTIFVEKHDFNGTILWNRNVLPFNETAFGTATSDSTTYVVEAGTNSVTMTSLDLNGNVRWTRILSRAGLGATQLFATSDGVYFAGSYPAPYRQLYDTQAFISRYDTNGSLVWNNQLDYPPGINCACVPSGLSGDSSGIFLGGTSYDNSIAGETPFYYGGSFLRKYDPNGNILWTNGQPGSSIDGQLVVSPSGIYTLAGSGLSRFDSSNGNQMWSIPIIGAVSDTGLGASVGVSANSVFVGGSTGPGFYNLAMIAGYDQSSSLVLGGVNPPFSFVILGGIVGVPLLGLSLFLRSSSKRHTYHSEGELPETRVPSQVRDEAAEWWIQKQLSKRDPEYEPGSNRDKSDAKDKSGSSDEKSSS